jgi:hypothetical protein
MYFLIIFKDKENSLAHFVSCTHPPVPSLRRKEGEANMLYFS